MALGATLGLSGCRSKEGSDANLGPAALAPPLGLVFSIPSGDALYFALDSLHVVGSGALENSTVVGAMVTASGDRLVALDGANDRILCLVLPDLEQRAWTTLGGYPTDADMNGPATLIYAVTSNGNLWRWEIAAHQTEAVEVGIHPRRMACRPPDGQEAWIVCPESGMLQMVDMTRFAVTTTLLFAGQPTDVQFSSDGRLGYLAFAGDPGRIAQFDAHEAVVIREKPLDGGPFDLALSSDDRFVAVSDSSGGALHVWDTNTDSLWTIPVGVSPSTVRFAHRTQSCYVVCTGSSHIVRVDVAANGPLVVDTLAMENTAFEFVIWERRE